MDGESSDDDDDMQAASPTARKSGNKTDGASQRTSAPSFTAAMEMGLSKLREVAKRLVLQSNLHMHVQSMTIGLVRGSHQPPTAEAMYPVTILLHYSASVVMHVQNFTVLGYGLRDIGIHNNIVDDLHVLTHGYFLPPFDTMTSEDIESFLKHMGMNNGGFLDMI